MNRLYLLFALTISTNSRLASKFLRVGVLLLASAIISLACCDKSNAQVTGNVNTIENQSSGTTVSTDSNPTITAILSTPGTWNGKTYTNWAFLLNDGTGSLEYFGTLPNGSPTPVVGDEVNISGKYSPFNAIPEIANATSFSFVSHGGTVPAPLPETIPTMNVTNPPLTIAGYLVNVQGVAITPAGGTFLDGTSSFNQALTITDLNSNSMVLYYYQSSYSLPNQNFYGTQVPSARQNITGIIDVFSGTNPEFLLMSMSPYQASLPSNVIYWYPGGPSTAQGGSGTWDTSSLNWNQNSDGSGGSNVTYSSANYAYFGGSQATSTVTIPNGGLAINGADFASNNYDVTGGTLTIGDGGTPLNTIDVDGGVSATIDSKVSGTNGLNLGGTLFHTGTLVLTNTANDFSGGITLSAGSLSISSDANLGSTSNSIDLEGGILKSTAGALSLDPGRNLTGNTGGGLDVGAGNTLTVNGSVSMTGALSLTNAGKVVLANSSILTGGMSFSSTGTAQFGDGSATALMSGGLNAYNTTGTATIQGSVNFSSIAENVNVATGGTLAITGSLSDSGRVTVGGGGILDVQGSASGLSSSYTLGSFGGLGATVILHDQNSLGSGIANLNSGTLYAATDLTGGNAFSSSLSLSLGGEGTDFSFPTTFSGSNMEFKGAVSVYKQSSNPSRLYVNNTTTFSGDWAVSTGTGFDPRLYVGGPGTLNLNGTVEEELPITVDQATLNVNTAMSNFGAQVTVVDGGKVNVGVTNALATSGSITVGDATTSGTVNLSGHDQTTGGISLINGSINGTGNTITVTGVVTGITIPANDGSGYTTTPNVTFSAPSPGGTTAMAVTSTNASGNVSFITITDPGSGYLSPPTVTIDPPSSGTTATATAFAGSIYVESGSISANLAEGFPGIALTKANTGTVTLSGSNSYSGGTSVTAGTLVAANVNALGTGALSISSSATAKLAVGVAGKPVVLPAVSIAGGVSPTGTLDIGSSKMVLTNTSYASAVSAYTVSRAQVTNALDGFAWDQPGITSSTVANDINNLGVPTSVAVILNNSSGTAGGGAGDATDELFYSDGSGSPTTNPNGLPQFAGTSVNQNSVLFKYTYIGDSNLDGMVDSTDFGLFLAGYNDPGTAASLGWAVGDYDYSGTVDSTDFGLFLAGYNYYASNPIPLNGAGGVQPVPEPAALVLAAIGLTGIGAVARRRFRAWRI